MYAIVNTNGVPITGTICITLLGARIARTNIINGGHYLATNGIVTIVRLITKPLLARELAEVTAS